MSISSVSSQDEQRCTTCTADVVDKGGNLHLYVEDEPILIPMNLVVDEVLQPGNIVTIRTDSNGEVIWSTLRKQK